MYDMKHNLLFLTSVKGLDSWNEHFVVSLLNNQQMRWGSSKIY
jgi:hypothetical protein